MTKLALITGITGQDGSYLSEFLLLKGYKIYGIVRRNSVIYNYKRLEHIRDKLILNYGDMSDGSCLNSLINNIIKNNNNFEVFEIYNLAAQSHVGVSFEIPEYTANVDGIGVLKILEVIKSLDNDIKNKIKFYQAGTSEMYGKVLKTPQNELTPFNPVSPYAAAKVYAYYITKCYREAYNIYAVNGILFNHESPRRGSNFLTMKVINGVKDIISGKIDSIELGNLDSKRDWGHAQDYCRGMWLMMQQNIPDDYVLSTGKTYSVREFVEKAFKFKGYDIKWVGNGLREIGIDQNNVRRISINPKFFRPCEVDLLLGDSSKAKKKLNWDIQFNSLEYLIKRMFEDK